MLARPDVVMSRGRCTVVNRTLTPDQAMIEDLLFVRDVLDEAGIDHLLVRGNGRRPVLAVAWTDRRALYAALTTACADEPFYVKAVDAERARLRLVADRGLTKTPGARILRLHRPRVEPVSGLRFGASRSVQIELWVFEDETITLPVENSLTRRTLPRHEAVRSHVEQHGRTWQTIETMFSAHASDVDFEIDLVFSWVDGSSDEWQKARAARMQSYVVGEGDDSEARFRQVDELRYALRSVHMYAPWVRRVFVATDSPRPAWLAEHPRVTFVRSEEFFADPSVLPTHSSHAVESQLHHIEGLSEHFLYSNDDMFFGRPVEPSMFFSPGGVTKFIESPTRIGLGGNDAVRSGFENSARVNRGLLFERFGRVTTRHLEHAATPLRKSVLAEMEVAFAEQFAATAASRFRSSTDISVTNSLYHYYALMTGRAVVQDSARTRYVDTTSRAGLDQMQALLASRSTDMFCLNDGSAPEVEADERAHAVRDFLARYFPFSAPWENPDR
ncbi:stealth family protein [Actinotalea sp. K2]|uniref:stealth family protein n=1 Tax=Actinotalea sp. K2 TaxID=2939438 RepID=UPI00201784F5|nr:stealth family protein [Actinotalea sp. K2]MCL3861820.1 stealth family protein [Actinotalea sp. K2]